MGPFDHLCGIDFNNDGEVDDLERITTYNLIRDGAAVDDDDSDEYFGGITISDDE